MSDEVVGFQDRHIGPRPADRDAMLEAIGVPTLDVLIDEAVPAAIRWTHPLDLPEPETEHAYLARLKTIASRNETFKSYIGLGYSDCYTPTVIQRVVFENPSWYTPYTPYQAEIAQGRLELLLNFQTMVRDLTAMDVANASLLDESTAAAEALTLLHRVQRRQRAESNRFFVSTGCYPQTIDVLRARAEPLGIELVLDDPEALAEQAGECFGALLQYPDRHGAVADLGPVIARAHEAGSLVAVATDLLALTLLTPPGEWGADVVLGNAQRFGVPLGFGGPHAAFFATRTEFVRQTPGRIIGVSVDAQGQTAYRMALQTREQHIRREKATSNICTAQALLANMAACYAIYHGPDGLRDIAGRVHRRTRQLADALESFGYRILHDQYFDTLTVGLEDVQGASRDAVQAAALAAHINLRYDDGLVGIALDETTSDDDVQALIAVFAGVTGASASSAPPNDLAPDRIAYPSGLARLSAFLEHPVFHAHRSETEMMRYLKSLERKDIGLDRSMIPLGSCTMKLNAASEMVALSWPEFSRLHPFTPTDQTQGYGQVVQELEQALRAITGLPGVSLQPNSGAQGEFAGLLVIRAYHRSRGDLGRDVVLIPASAHGTNPASAIMAGMRVVVVACDDQGNVDLADLTAKAGEAGTALAALMVTYPSTHGVFEDAIQQVCALVHAQGGQVYMDGANMNAQVGLTSPAAIGADVCHLNLHKTFAIPHGGGGPGMGPIAVAEHLSPFLPGHVLCPVGGSQAIAAVSGAPWGSASILLISHAYVCMLGGSGLTESTRHALLNANYLKARLEAHYPVLYARPNGRVAHELIFDLRELKRSTGIDEQDVAKRLMDYGFHAPTVSFPVPGTLMVEPTESESKAELDRFCEAMGAVRAEIEAVATGAADRTDNVLKNAPHTAAMAAADEWSHPYTRQQAVYPLPFVRADKFWPSVARIDNPYGDRNLMCVCPPLEAYAEGEESA